MKSPPFAHIKCLLNVLSFFPGMEMVVSGIDIDLFGNAAIWNIQSDADQFFSWGLRFESKFIQTLAYFHMLHTDNRGGGTALDLI